MSEKLMKREHSLEEAVCLGESFDGFYGSWPDEEHHIHVYQVHYFFFGIFCIPYYPRLYLADMTNLYIMLDNLLEMTRDNLSFATL